MFALTRQARGKVTATTMEGCHKTTGFCFLFFFFHRAPWVLILLSTNHNILKEITAPSLLKAVIPIHGWK